VTAKPLAVTVHARDPLSKAGVVSYLKDQPDIDVFDQPEPPAGRVGPSVAVVIAERLNEAAATELRRLVKDEHRSVALVVGQLREPELMALVEWGVHTIVWRHQVNEQLLVKAIHSAARGSSDLPQDLLTRLLVQMGRSKATPRDPNGAFTGLTPREADVLRFVADGLETRQIARKLSYSERTVKNVLHGLMKRMQLHNRAHAVAYALREGFL
jgi:DNA-binding NarL/FixJ family response regulator